MFGIVSATESISSTSVTITTVSDNDTKERVADKMMEKVRKVHVPRLQEKIERNIMTYSEQGLTSWIFNQGKRKLHTMVVN